MRFAVISNILSNLDALNAVLDAIENYSRPVDRTVCAGDVVGRGPHPNEVVDVLRARDIPTVLGNYDDAVAFDRIGSGVDFASPEAEEADARALAWTRDVLTPDNLAFLQGLPRDIRLQPAPRGIRVERNQGDARTAEYRKNYFTKFLFGGWASRPARTPGKKLLVMHGSPRALNEHIRSDSALSILAVIAREAQTDVLVAAHSGESFRISAQDTTFIGVAPLTSGPVGGSAARANFTVVDTSESISVESVQIEYDSRGHRAAAVARGLPEE